MFPLRTRLGKHIKLTIDKLNDIKNSKNDLVNTGINVEFSFV